ncbi:MAG: homoserine kinase [Pseudomonadota bacterium]
MAVYTHVPRDALVAFLDDYDVGALQDFRGVVQGVENTNYIVETDVGRYILTLFEKRTDPADLPFFVAFMEHIAGAGIRAPSPIENKGGQILQSLWGRPAIHVTFVEGRAVDIPNTEQCASFGRTLAKMHLAAGSFDQTRDNKLSISGWRALAEKCGEDANTFSPGLAQLIKEELPRIEHAWPQDLARGAVHLDLYPDNVFFQGNTLSGVIDFYFSCTDFFVYDIALALNPWSGEGNFDLARAQALLKAYEEVRPLSDAERAAIPVLMRGAAMRILLTRLYDWLNQVDGASVNVKDPAPYAQILEVMRSPGAIDSGQLFS